MLFPKRAFTIAFLAFIAVCHESASHATTSTFTFKRLYNGDVLDNQTSGTVTEGAFQVQMEAAPGGALLNVEIPGMGVNSSGLTAVTDGDIDKISIPGGSSPGVSGVSESVTFSFNRDGVMREIGLDGLHDENLEYAVLTLPDNSVISIFDFELPTRLAEQGFDLSDLTAPNIHLGSGDNTLSDDDNLLMDIPFLAGQSFKLTFAVEPAPQRVEGGQTITYIPNDTQLPNGFRIESITVVPEPSAFAVAVGLLLAIAAGRQRS